MKEKKIEARKSKISGSGLFAKQDIKAGESICNMNGELMDLDLMIHKVDNDLEEGSDPLGIDDKMYMDLDEPYRCCNHSCFPNAFLRGKNELVAIKDISKDEEITFDYSTTMDDQIPREEQWTMKCKCKSPNCRKVVDQFKFLPRSVQKYYLDNKFAPDFILRNFKNI